MAAPILSGSNNAKPRVGDVTSGTRSSKRPCHSRTRRVVAKVLAASTRIGADAATDAIGGANHHAITRGLIENLVRQMSRTVVQTGRAHQPPHIL
jgi:hypothetical protein